MIHAGRSIVVLMVGGVILKICLTDVHLRYVKAGFTPALITAAVVLLALGLAGLLLHREPAPDGDDGSLAGDRADGDGHGHGADSGPRVAWLLLLPVLSLFLIAPPAPGSYAAARDAGTVTDPGTSHYPRLPAGEVVVVVARAKIAAISLTGVLSDLSGNSPRHAPNQPLT